MDNHGGACHSINMADARTKGQKSIKKQLALEKIVTMLYGLVRDNMGAEYMSFTPYIGTLFALSIVGSLSSLTTLRPYTADLSVILSWSVVTFLLIQTNNIKKHGVLGWLKSFAQPVAFITPLNIISEIANPVSMTFRHFGNIAAGLVITSLVYGGLASLSAAALAWILTVFLHQCRFYRWVFLRCCRCTLICLPLFCRRILFVC